MISKKAAHIQLIIGYIFVLAGIVIESYNNFLHNPFFSIFMIGYACWSAYWGWRIVYTPIDSFFSRMMVFENNLIKLFIEYILMRLIIYSIIFAVGLLVGALGGAIYKQIKLSQIAYSSSTAF